MISTLPGDWLVFALRLLFLVLLYGFLFAVLKILKSDLSSPAAAPRPVAQSRAPAPEPPASEQPAELLLVPLSGEPGVPLRRPIELKLDNVIGRDPGSDVVLDDSSVSGRHARLRTRDGVWAIADLRSTNGTRLNERLVEGETHVQPGDLLTFGLVRCKLVRRS
ncbi:MAG: FHA domain-containing protein [Chloroflexi bacterium]|nr:FHA domain-containing protein [Chloroflexota bacterium]